MVDNDPVRGRRHNVTLTDEQLDMIAEMAADKAVAKVTTHIYSEIGKGIVRKFFWIVGVCSVGLYVWLQQKGVIK